MRPVNIQFGLSRSDDTSPSTLRSILLLVVLVVLGSHASYSKANSDDQPPANELTSAESPAGPAIEDAQPLESETSPDPEESNSGQADITPDMDNAESTESDSESEGKPSDDKETEQVTNVVILVQGNRGGLKPIRGAAVFVSIKEHDDVQTSTNAKGLANISIPTGRVKIQVTARDWKTFGKFYDLRRESEEIQITLESRKPGAP